MMNINPQKTLSKIKVLSGMRPTGALHLGHYHGVLKNWLKLQENYQCYFFIADWHALTTHYQDHLNLKKNSIEMMLDFLSVGMNSDKATFFIQSQVKEHAELALVLSMITPVSWLERVPSYKDLQEKLSEKNLLNVGFLYYPLLQTADILAYDAEFVPVGEDQLAHIELSREIARRFNDTFGRGENFAEKVAIAMDTLNAKELTLYKKYRKAFLQEGNQKSLLKAKNLIQSKNIALESEQILRGFLENQGQMILTLPQAMLTETCKLPGLDGQKMSKSYHNTIFLRETADGVAKKIKTMQTDPARVRKKDPGNPEKCPVFDFHQVYSSNEVQDWVTKGCKFATIGCLECKAPLIEAINFQLTVFAERRKEFDDQSEILKLLNIGAEKAKDQVSDVLRRVRSAMNLLE